MLIKTKRFFEWLGKYKRNKFPNQVRYNSRSYQYNSAYWVWLDKLTPGTLASIDAKFTSPNQIEITTADLDAFTLNLSGHPKYNSSQALVVTINGKKIKTQSTETISFTVAENKWTNEKYEAGTDVKRPGAEGPIGAAFGDRHIYVYGTSGNPSEAELKSRMEIATQAANWSAYRNAFLGRMMFFPRIVADKDVRPSDFESSNLILFGTKETNTLVEQYSDRLPMHFNVSSAADHGLLYVFPIDGHYIVVSSGLPWWTGAEQQTYPLPPAQLLLPGFKDYILFKNDVKNPVAEGYFDHNWKVPATETTKLTSGKTLSLK
jgi:hypothetical protein